MGGYKFIFGNITSLRRSTTFLRVKSKKFFLIIDGACRLYQPITVDARALVFSAYHEISKLQQVRKHKHRIFVGSYRLVIVYSYHTFVSSVSLISSVTLPPCDLIVLSLVPLAVFVLVTESSSSDDGCSCTYVFFLA